jgi:uncharacterized repeat protein (TIGR01451 family)
MKTAKHWATKDMAIRATALIALSITSLQALAQDKNCVTLKTEGQVEENYTDAQGKPAKRLVAPGKVLPGGEVIWTITATNSCDKAADKVVIDNAVPEHMVYVADSAMGVNTEMSFSLNGREFKKLSELVVRDADGKTRAPRADEIKAIRWMLNTAVGAKQIAFVRYRARVQ